MTDGVTKRYELTATRAVVLDVISSNIIDPLTGSQARENTSKWIFNGMPETDRLGQGAGGWKFPIVVFDFPDMDNEIKTLSRGAGMIKHTVSVECMSRTRLQANELSEQIKNIIEVTGLSEFRIAALHYLGTVGTTHDVDFIGGNKFYIVTIDYEFERFD